MSFAENKRRIALSGWLPILEPGLGKQDIEPKRRAQGSSKNSSAFSTPKAFGFLYQGLFAAAVWGFVVQNPYRLATVTMMRAL